MRHTLKAIALGLFVASCSQESAQIRKPSTGPGAEVQKNSADQFPEDSATVSDSADSASEDSDLTIASDSTDSTDGFESDANGDGGDGANDDGGAAETDGNGAEGTDGDDGAGSTEAGDGSTDTGGMGDDTTDGMSDGTVDGVADGEVLPENPPPPPPPPPPAQITPWRTLLKNIYRHRIAFHKLGLNRDNYLSASNDPIRREGIIHYERAGLAFEVFQRAPTTAEFPNCAPRKLVRCLSGGLNQADFVHYLAYECPSNFTVDETLGFVCSQNGADRTRFMQFRDQFNWTHKGINRAHAAYVVSTANPGVPWQVAGTDFFMPKR